MGVVKSHFGRGLLLTTAHCALHTHRTHHTHRTPHTAPTTHTVDNSRKLQTIHSRRQIDAF